MTINLTPWFILWALTTTVVVFLAFWRLMMGLHHLNRLHIGKERELAQEVRATRTMALIELWGKTLTTVALVLIVGIGVAWFYNVLTSS